MGLSRVIVECWKDGQLIRAYRFRDGAPVSDKEFTDLAKMQLTKDRQGFPPYTEFAFVLVRR
jgi:hypothetical protein